MDSERIEYLFGDDAERVVADYDLTDEFDRDAAVADVLLPRLDRRRTDGASHAVLTIVASQILDDDPPSAWLTAQRLSEAGLPLSRVLSQMSIAVGQELLAAVEADLPFDRHGLDAVYDSLPLPEASDVVAAVVDELRTNPGLAADELDARVLARLDAEPDSLVERMLHQAMDDLVDGPVHWLLGDRTILVPEAIDGKVFTTELNDLQRQIGTLSIGLDVGALWCFDSAQLDDGTELQLVSAEFGHLALAGPGWLDAFDADATLAVGVTAATSDDVIGEPLVATLTITQLDAAPPIDDALVAAVRQAYDALVDEPGLPVTGSDLLLELCFEHPDWFAEPQAPLAQLCAAAGLERRGSLVAHDESVWLRSLWHRRFHRALDLLDDRELRLAAGRALDRLDDPAADARELRESLVECAHPELLDVLTEVLFPAALELTDRDEILDHESPGRLFELVDRAIAAARTSRETAVAEYLACVLYERCAAPEFAEQHLRRAVDAGARLGPEVERMGWYCFDRGDARGAMKWWRELTHLPEAAATIEPFLRPDSSRPKLGRNDPCWCGSGRKFKQCHLGADQRPALPDRVNWLIRKAVLWTEHAHGDISATMTDLATVYVAGDPEADAFTFEHVDDDELRHWFVQAFSDPLVMDVALHEGGLFAQFLRHRGVLLPDDERELAAEWLAVDRSVHEVERIERGEGLQMKNLATDESVWVTERRASLDLQGGELVCARILPDGEHHQIVGGVISVRPGQETPLLAICDARSGTELCAWAGALRLRSTRGDALGAAGSVFDPELFDLDEADLDELDLDELDPDEPDPEVPDAEELDTPE